MKQRKVIRMQYHDYREGIFSVTISCKHLQCHFGDVVDGKVILNDSGQFAQETWSNIPDVYPWVVGDEFIVMPNHVHGILALFGADEAPQYTRFGAQPRGGLSVIIGQYKSIVTKWCRQNGNPEFFWLGRYWDRMIRNERELEIARNYIIKNPERWAEKHGNKGCLGKQPRS